MSDPTATPAMGADPTFKVPDTLREVWDAASAATGICSLELQTAYEATLGHRTTPEEARVGTSYRDAIGRIQQYAVKVQDALIDAIKRDLTLTPWEQLLSDPMEQFDPDGAVLASVLAHQQKSCQHRGTTTHPPTTAGGSSVTVCNDCGIYS